MISRRELLVSGGVLALSGCGGAAPAGAGRTKSAEASRAIQDVLGAAIDAAKRAGASYADARVVRRRFERVATREDHVEAVDSSESFGVGVRVLAMGAWGFAATSRVAPETAAETARRAVAIARADARLLERPNSLAPEPVYRDTWQTPMKLDPFNVPLSDKATFFLALWDEARRVPGVKYGSGWCESSGEWKVLATSDGTVVEQSITRIYPGFDVTAIGAQSGEFETRRHEIPPMQAGWEYVALSSMHAKAREIAEDAVRKLKSPQVTPGKRDVILAPSHLWLTIHESVGHPTELDRALGYEANLAGTSFATPDKLGKLKYAADFVTLYADKTTPGGLATCGYDDDGVRTQRWDLVKNGLFVGYQTTRDQAAWIGEKRSRGTSYAESYRSFPFQRMPNVSLAPSDKEATLDDLIAACDDGVLITGDGSWSIDHQRYNFQFGGQMFYEVKKGKVTTALRDVAYQSNTPEFWNACRQIGGAKSWQLFGAMHDGKGEPGQSNPVSHGCPPARFGGVNVLNTNTRKKGA
jgi:TldD protein